MSRSLNKVMLIGNVGNDPEIRATSGGARVAKLSLATNRAWSGRDGQQQEKTEWHRLTFFGRLVDIVEQWVHKGDRLYVEGRIETRSWDDKDGQKKYMTEIIADRIQLLGGPSGGGRKSSPRDETDDTFGREESGDTDDDIPF